MALLKVFNHTLMITGFVFVMMLVVEYVNVQTRGVWQQKVFRNKWGQYILAAFLGAIPGCLGAFTVVAMFSHRILSIGAGWPRYVTNACTFTSYVYCRESNKPDCGIFGRCNWAIIRVAQQ